MLAPVGLAYVQHYGRKWKLRRDLWLVGLALCWIGCIVSGCIWIWQCKPEALMVSLQLPLVNALLIEVCMLAACGTERANACRSILACTYVQRSTTKNAYGTIKIGTPSQSAQLWHGALTGFLCMKSLVYPIPSDDRLRKNLRLWTGCFAVATCMSISLALVFSLIRNAQDKYYIYCLVSALHSQVSYTNLKRHNQS
jgi:hypothetical protein